MADRPQRRRVGWHNLPGLGPIETDDLVTRVRRFRGRKTIHQILIALGIHQTKQAWLTIMNICRKYEITTAGPDDPEYFRKAVARDKAVDAAQENLRRQIALAKREKDTAPPYKSGKLEW